MASGAALIEESGRRWQRLRYPYDPLTGEGSHEERRPLAVGVDVGTPEASRIVESIDAPVQCFGEGLPEDGLRPDGDFAHLAGFVALFLAIEAAGSVQAYAEATRQRPVDVFAAVQEARLFFDPEFWFASCVRVDYKGRPVPFVLRHPQRVYLRVLLEMLWQGKPLRVVLLKARQWGGSTLTQLLFAWIQLFHRTAWHSSIVALDQTQAGHVRQMFERLAETYPESIHPGTLTFRPYARLQNIRRLVERGCFVGVGSVERPDAVRSYTYYLCHASEVGAWPSTAKTNADELVQALEGGLASGETNLAFSAFVKESTAKGVGTYFHADWVAAERGESSDAPVFVAWFQIEKYAQDLESYAEADVEAFVESFDDYERWLWEPEASGGCECTLEQIRWYRQKLRNYRGKRFKMHSEYPSTAAEAFISTGSRYFAPDVVAKARATTCAPEAMGSGEWAGFTGELRAEAQSGPLALEGLRPVVVEKGALRVWRRPGDPYSGLVQAFTKGRPLRNRYVGFLDPGGKTDAADWSILKILDRAPELWGQRPEVVARLKLHLRADLVAWYAARVCQWYEEALLAVEVNRYRKSGDDARGFEPEWALAVIEEIAGEYSNMYHRETPGEVYGKTTRKVGFFTTKDSKGELINALDAGMEDGLFVARSAEMCDECDVFEAKPDGTLGARDGKHDDELIATAGVVWMATKSGSVPEMYVEVPIEPSRVSGRPSRF